MKNIDSDKYLFYVEMFIGYINIQKKYSVLLEPDNSDSIERKLLEETYRQELSSQFEAKEEAKKEVVKSYLEHVRNYPDVMKVYFSDIKVAAKDMDLIFLDVLFDVSLELPLSNPIVDVFILKTIVHFLKENDESDVYITSFGKMFFEKVLDTSDNNLKEYSEVVRDVFALGVSDAWYADFNQSIQKLLARALKNRDTFEGLLPGLNINISEIKEDLIDFINYHYFSKGKVDEHFNWLER